MTKETNLPLDESQAFSLSMLLENDLEQAKLLLAAKDVLAELQDMFEKLAKMNAEDILPLSEQMKSSFGSEEAAAFESVAMAGLQSASDAIRQAKDDINTAILQVEGKIPPSNDMMDPAAPEDAMADIAPDTGDAETIEDPFGGAESAAGPAEEPLGRAKKESAMNSKPVLEGKKPFAKLQDLEDKLGKASKEDKKKIQGEIDSIKRARKLKESTNLMESGKNLLLKESISSLMSWMLNEASVTMPAEKFKDFATSLTAKAANNPVKVAGWIGQKKYGAAGMAQLATPTIAPSAKGISSVVEGEEQEEENLEEARNRGFDDDDGEEEDNGKKSNKQRDQDRAAVRKSKDMNESERAANAIAMVIEANILATGKGSAAAVVKHYTANESLVEGQGSSILEAFQSMFGATPARYSMAKAREAVNETPLSSMDQKNLSGAMSKMANKLAVDKNAGNKPLQSAMTDMDATERTAVQKLQQQMKKDGKDPKKVSDLVAGASEMTNESEGEDHKGAVEVHGVMGVNSTKFRKRFKNQAALDKWLDKNEGNVEVHGTRDAE